MDSPAAVPADARARRQPWPSLWATALVSLVAQLALCQFFSFGRNVPLTIDVNPCNLWKYAYHFPPRGEFLVLNWFGIPNFPPPLHPFGLAAAHLSPWFFFTAYAPVIATCALLAMAAFLRELGLARPAALFGGVVYAWQGDLLPFVFPGHYAYITTWPFFAIAAWAALRARRHWAYALIAGASCGLMVGLQPDRGGIACLLIAALYLAPACLGRASWTAQIRPLVLCVVAALLISLAGLFALYQSNIQGVKLGGAASREQAFGVATLYSLSPADTITYLVPGFFGWYNGSESGPYWGLIGQTPGWGATHQGVRNMNLAISTTGTAASILALLGLCLLLPGAAGRYFGNAHFSQRQLDFGRVLLVLGGGTLVLAWGYHTPLYRALFAFPLMDKWRDPLKWLEIFNFAAVVLAALGAEHLVRSIVEEKLRHVLVLFLLVANSVLFLLLLASYPLAIVVAASLGNGGGYDEVGIANVMHTLHASLGFALLTGVLLWLALAGVWRGERLQQWQIVNPWLRRLWSRALAPENRAATLAVCLAVLAALQLGWVAGQFLQPRELARLTSTNPLLQALEVEGPTVRVAVPSPQPAILNTFLQYQFAADRISSIDISAASRIPDALTTFVDAFDNHPARLWLLGGVKNVAIAEQDLGTLRQDPEVAANIEKADGYTLYQTPDDQPTHALVRLRDYFAKATFVPGGEACSGDDAILKRLADPKWNPRSSILYATTGPGAGKVYNTVRNTPDTTPAAGTPPVKVTRYTPHEIDLAVNAPTVGYVLINDQYDPDWQVTLNGRSAPLLRADYLLRAVTVPPGPSTVVLRYVAHYRLPGLTLPVIATNACCDALLLLAWLAAAAALWRANHAPPQNPGSRRPSGDGVRPGA
jgi:hypothetical protein